MKKIIGVVAGFVLLTSFSIREEESIDGIWLGYYKSGLSKEKMIIKFNNDDRIELYAGDVKELPQYNGSYKLNGDSVSFTYTTATGEKFVMLGHVSRRKNYVDGTWKTPTSNGSFFIEKQDVEEKTVAP